MMTKVSSQSKIIRVTDREQAEKGILVMRKIIVIRSQL